MNYLKACLNRTIQRSLYDLMETRLYDEIEVVFQVSMMLRWTKKVACGNN